jgi:hypothetical protein
VFHAYGFGRIDEMAIAQVINRVGIVVAFSDKCMGRYQHLLDPLAGVQKGCWIAEVATHNFCPPLLEKSQVERSSGHRTYRFAFFKQALSNNAPETATGPNNQNHVLFLSSPLYE